MELETNCSFGRVAGIGGRIAIFIDRRDSDRTRLDALSCADAPNCSGNDLGGCMRPQLAASVRVLFFSLDNFLVGDVAC